MKACNVKEEIFVDGAVTVREIWPDGTINIKRKDENVVVNSGILLLINYLIGDSEKQPLSGITHLAIGDGKPDFIDATPDPEETKLFIHGLTELKNEVLRVIRWDVKYKKYDDFMNLVDSEEPTNIVDFVYRLRTLEPPQKIYISELGMFGGTVKINHTPYSLPEDVVDKGIMFSYKYYDPPIDKFPETILEFNWRIKFSRG